MAPVAGTNPFEDEEEMGSGSFRVKRANASASASNNPFDATGTSTSFDDTVSSPTPMAMNMDMNMNMQDDMYDEPDNLPIEASWQYLGDLPYRRIPVYSNVKWSTRMYDSSRSRTSVDMDMDGTDISAVDATDIDDTDYGLATFPTIFKEQQRSDLLDPRDIREMLSTSSITKVAACPNGGPIATITLPLVGTLKTAQLRIMTNAGRLLASIELPPKGPLSRIYAASDVMTIGFTNRTVLVLLLRDSLCLTYDLQGAPLLPPFYILPEVKGAELLQACVYGDGVAVLSPQMQCAICEFLDDSDDPAYANGAHLGSRRITPSTTQSVEGRAAGEMFGGSSSSPHHHTALVTPLPTATYCRDAMYQFVAIAVLSRFHTTCRHPEVFLSTSDNSVCVVNTVTTEITDVDCRARIKSPIVAMSFAPNGRFLACFTQSSILTVISTSFETKVLDFDTSEGSHSAPQDVQWCGEDSVVLHWKKLGVLMVGPYGDWLRFPYENTDNLHICPEVDCCRVVTDHSVELLQRVPPATAALLRMGSIEPSAMLLDASDAFNSGSPTSDETARTLVKSGMLLEAIETCSDAATREFHVALQKRLLRAASYGMHFFYKEPSANNTVIMGGSTDTTATNVVEGILPSQVALKFTAAARKLRILNALRDARVGLVLTTLQLDHIQSTGVIARLVAINRPALATAIAKYLNLPNHVQLYARSHKAAAFVASSDKSDAETAEAAIAIINDAASDAATNVHNSGGYASVALAAGKAGRPGVANLLLMLESSVADKVPALISTGAFADAMAVATSARDAEFIFFTLMEYEKACMSNTASNDAQAKFLGTVINKFTPEGFHTLRRYLETMPDIKNVMNLLLRAQRSIDAGSVMAKKAFTKEDQVEILTFLADASRIFSMGKDTGFQKTCTDEHIDLLKDQQVLRTKYGTPEVAPHGSSLTATMVAMINFAGVNKRESHRLLADVDKVAKKFRVPEKRVWHIKVKAFAESQQWPQLRTLGDSAKKPPIGFKPFVQALIRGQQSTSEVLRYMDRISNPEERYELYCQAKLWTKALEEAGKLRDARRVAHVRSQCQDDATIQRLANDLLNRMNTTI